MLRMIISYMWRLFNTNTYILLVNLINPLKLGWKVASYHVVADNAIIVFVPCLFYTNILCWTNHAVVKFSDIQLQ